MVKTVMTTLADCAAVSASLPVPLYMYVNVYAIS